VARVRDILIVLTEGGHGPELDGATPFTCLLAHRVVTVGDGITVEALDDDLAEAVMNVSEPVGENFRPHTRQWGELPVSFTPSSAWPKPRT
jgi:hypothetical protein